MLEKILANENITNLASFAYKQENQRWTETRRQENKLFNTMR